MGGTEESFGSLGELDLPPTKWGYCLASHENPGTGENTERSGKMIVLLLLLFFLLVSLFCFIVDDLW